MPPAPWQTGIPETAPANRFAEPNVVARRPGRTRFPSSPKYTFAASAVARHELANESGTCGTTRTVNAVTIVAVSRLGRARAEGPNAASPPARTTVTIAPTATRASVIG